MDASSIPQKRCTRCDKLFPATTEYFYKAGRYLRGWCKLCHIKMTTPNVIKWQRANVDKKRITDKRFRLNHPLSNRRKIQRRQANKQRLEASFTDKDWIRALKYFNETCAYCGNGPSLFDHHKTLQQDHYIPISKGGGYIRENIVPACQTCNCEKSNNDPEMWCIKRFGKKSAKIIINRIERYFRQFSEGGLS